MISLILSSNSSLEATILFTVIVVVSLKSIVAGTNGGFTSVSTLGLATL